MEVFDKIKKYLESVIEIPPTEWIRLIPLLKIKTVKKGDHYFRQGEQIDSIGFVISGLLYNYYTDLKGERIVKYFISEGGLVADYSSLILNRNTTFSSVAIESSTLVMLKYADLTGLFKRHSCWERLGRLNAERLYIEKEVREFRFMSCRAKERYELFIQENPELAPRIADYLIASYLGMTPVSLSRIRGSR